MSKYSTLSDKIIKEYLNDGKIVISPFNEKHLNTSSYDVSIGSYYYTEKRPNVMSQHKIYNMYSEKCVNDVWQLNKAMSYIEYKKMYGKLENVKDTDEIILLHAGETILAHTNEFIGGVSSVTTMMQTRSSIGRNFISAHICAGWGDVGYYNRWTFEITNHSRNYSIPLIVGTRIAQIVFLQTDDILDKSYNDTGKYQNNKDLDTMIKEWKPSDMLPKLYNDFERQI